MRCKHYFGDGNYACMKKKEARTPDDDCPIYKGDSGFSGAQDDNRCNAGKFGQPYF